MAITKLMHMKESKSGSPALHLKHAITYILNSEKTQEGKLVGGLGMDGSKAAFQHFLETKKYFGKEKGRQGYHFVLSFPEGEVTPELAYQITQEFTEQFLQNNYDCVFAVHDDTIHKHGHVIFNSVSLDGRKYHYQNGDWERIIQPIVNSLCQSYGLSYIDFDETRNENRVYSAWEAEKKGDYDWRKIIRMDMDEAIFHSNSYEKFLDYMKTVHHYTIRQGVSHPYRDYLSLKPHGKERAVRSYQLGVGYSVEEIQKRLAHKEVPIETDPVLLETNNRPRIKKYQFYKQPRRRPNLKFPLFAYWISIKRIYRPVYRSVAWKYKKELLHIRKLEEQCRYLAYHSLTDSSEIQMQKEECKKQIEQLIYQKKEIEGKYQKYKKEFALLQEHLALEKEKDESKAVFPSEKQQRMQDIGKLIDLEQVSNLYQTRQKLLQENLQATKSKKKEERLLGDILKNEKKYTEGARELSHIAVQEKRKSKSVPMKK